MLTTKILGEATGIQHQGLTDRSGNPKPANLTNGLIVGRFRRGRTDQPMFITADTMRGRLGHDPNNLDYMAVQDCLDTGVPSVWVLRVGEPLDNRSNV